jgi:hypothetical protein
MTRTETHKVETIQVLSLHRLPNELNPQEELRMKGVPTGQSHLPLVRQTGIPNRADRILELQLLPNVLSQLPDLPMVRVIPIAQSQLRPKLLGRFQEEIHNLRPIKTVNQRLLRKEDQNVLLQSRLLQEELNLHPPYQMSQPLLYRRAMVGMVIQQVPLK